MRFALAAVLLVAAGCGSRNTTGPAPAAPSGNTMVINFEKAAPGEMPADFSAEKTGDGAPGKWVVRAAGAGKVLAQISDDATNRRFPLCIYDPKAKPLAGRNVDVSVRFRAISGKLDQAGGIVVRYQDPGNYYVLRANALEDNVRIYRVKDGKRLPEFASMDTKVAPNQWHTLRLIAKGPSFTACFNDNIVFQANDDSLQTAGKVGLWTKADSVTEFDDLKITVLPE